MKHTKTDQQSDCGSAVWRNDGKGWYVKTKKCKSGCEPVRPEITPHVVPQEITTGCRPKSEDSSNECTGEETNCTVTACNGEQDEEGRRKLYEGETVSIRFYERNWIIEAHPINVINKTLLSEGPLCPDDQKHGVSMLTPVDYCHGARTKKNDPDPPLNTYGLSGPDAADALIINHAATDWKTATFAQLKHQCAHVLADKCGNDQIISYDDCVIYADVWKKTSLMSCEEEPNKELQIQLFQHQLVKEITAPSCDSGESSAGSGAECGTQDYKQIIACLFEQQPPETTKTALTLKARAVVTNWRINGLCFEIRVGTIVEVDGCCVGEDEWVQKECGELCPSDSSSS